MTVRLKDIAEILDLSVSTVSAALQGRRDISKVTQERVQEMVKRLGYQPNTVARSLVTRKSNVFGVVIPDLSRSFFSEVLKGVEVVATQAGYNLLVCNTAENSTREQKTLQMLRSRQVDGMLLASAQDVRENDWLDELKNLRVPIVFIDRSFPGTHFVGGDDEAIGALATRHLLSQGYRRIAHISGPQSVSTAVGRARGYRQVLAAAGIPLNDQWIVEANYHEESGGYRAMKQLLALNQPPDAVFAASDPIAIGAMQAALEANLSIPETIGLIGVGNHQYSNYLRVPLSTIDQQRANIGQDAAELLLKLISKRRVEPPTRIIVEPKLIFRASSCRVSGVHAG